MGITLRVKASLARSSGDITLQGEAAGNGMVGSTKFAAGVRQASMTLETRPDNQDNLLSLALRWDSEISDAVGKLKPEIDPVRFAAFDGS